MSKKKPVMLILSVYPETDVMLPKLDGFSAPRQHNLHFRWTIKLAHLTLLTKSEIAK